MTVSTLLAIADDAKSLKHEHQMVLAAERLAEVHVSKRRGALMIEEPGHSDAFGAIVEEVRALGPAAAWLKGIVDG
jgi:hypothetical protein